MNRFLLRAGFLLLSFAIPFYAGAQLLIQDFDLLSSVDDWAEGDTPTAYQVSYLGSEPASGSSNTVYFELNTEAGDQALRLVKANSQFNTHKAYFVKNTGFATAQVLKVQFDLSVAAAPGTSGALGSIYVGHNFSNTGFYPEHKNRFATIDLNFEGNNTFSVNNAILGNSNQKTEKITGESRITIFMNNTGSDFTYLSPAGMSHSVGPKKIDIWIDEQLEIDEAVAHAAEGVVMSALKFSSRNNQLEGTATFDNFLIEAVQPFSDRPQLTQAGGTFTVGSGGAFNSLSNPGGVFDALNNLQSPINAPFIFRFVSDLVGETGQVQLQEIAGSAEGRTIKFVPHEQNRTYSISGDNTMDEGAMISLLGADRVIFDGRTPGDFSEGLGASRQLVFRNAGTAPTFLLRQDATHNTLSYCNIQGVSTDAREGVIMFGNAGANGNDHNTLLYNRIGGYSNQHPVNAIAAYNTASGITEGVLVSGNQFYSFTMVPAVNRYLEPSTIKIDIGHAAWTIDKNHFFQENGSALLVEPGAYTLHGLNLLAGADHLVQGNFLGGNAVYAAGGKARAEATGPPGGSPSILPLRIDNPEGSVQVVGNVIKEIEVTGSPAACNVQAFGALVLAGAVDFTNNAFGDKEGRSIVIRAKGASAVTGSYLVAPVHYSGAQSSGTVLDNFMGGFSLESIPASGGTTALAFAGVFAEAGAAIAEISQNTIAGVQSTTSGQTGVSITGILASGAGSASILRNVLYNFYNDASDAPTDCAGIVPAQDPDVNGIVVNHDAGSAGEVLVANNMITFYSPPAMATSETVYQGILLSSSMKQPIHVYYNSVYVHGVDNAATGQSFMLYKRGAAPAIVKNNMLLNTRSTNKPNFIIGALHAGLESDHNLLYQASGAAGPDFGLYATGDNQSSAKLADNCTGWRSISGQDQQSVCDNAAPYLLNPEEGNLRMVLSLEENPLIDKGIPVAQIDTDIDLVSRIVPDIGASEGYNVWIGVASTDWFDGSNWSVGTAPDCGRYGQLAILPQGAPIPNADGTAGIVAHQPVIRKGGAYYRNLLVLAGATLTIGDPTAHLQQCTIDNAALEGIYNQGRIRYVAAGEISLKGILNQEGVLETGKGMFSLNGAGSQTINSQEPISFWQLAVQGGGDKVLNSEVVVKGSLNLESGIVYSSPQSLLQLDQGAVIAGTPDALTYVAGPMIKRFANAGESFTYPLGDSGVFGPLTLITDEAEQQTSASFMVEYYLRGTDDPADLPPADQVSEGVMYVSDYELWRINRLEGEASARVGLYYHELTGITEPEQAEVVRWVPAGQTPEAKLAAWALTGAQEREEVSLWELEGPRILSPPLDFFTFFAFGSQAPQETLPVTLLSFGAHLEQEQVRLDWVTVIEENSSHFNIQRSLDGLAFHTIGRLEAAGNSHERIHYQFIDNEAVHNGAGEVYYRLEQVDIDGTLDWSYPVVVALPDSGTKVNVHPNPFSDRLLIELQSARQQALQLRLLNLEGRMLLQQHVAPSQATAGVSLAGVEELPAGIYVLEISDAEAVSQIKIVKK